MQCALALKIKDECPLSSAGKVVTLAILKWSRENLARSSISDFVDAIESSESIHTLSYSPDEKAMTQLHKIVFREGMRERCLNNEIDNFEFLTLHAEEEEEGVEYWSIKCSDKLASVGPDILEASVSNGSFLCSTHLELHIRGSPTAVRELIGRLHDWHPYDQLLINSHDINNSESGLKLTQKQLKVFEAAWAHGYFEIPRRITIEGLRDVLNLSTSTIGTHLRKIEYRMANSFHRRLN